MILGLSYQRLYPIKARVELSCTRAAVQRLCSCRRRRVPLLADARGGGDAGDGEAIRRTSAHFAGREAAVRRRRIIRNVNVQGRRQTDQEPPSCKSEPLALSKSDSYSRLTLRRGRCVQ